MTLILPLLPVACDPAKVAICPPDKKVACLVATLIFPPAPLAKFSLEIRLLVFCSSQVSGSIASKLISPKLNPGGKANPATIIDSVAST